ncbi:MAG: tryptophan synthase subunit alpha [Deltaproteobacteria bacterium]|nr:tryptophan synthase subunit alpha [Deltaproteobacteria bacterium]
MSRVGACFDRLRADDRRGFVAYLTAGDPDLVTSRELVVEAWRRGADVIELGVPWSDPSADGPAIQAAMQRALGAGGSFRATLRLCEGVRRESEVPIVLFGYYNPVFVYGVDAAARDARNAGADAFLVVDLPPEEAGEVTPALAAQGLDLVPLVSPESDEARMERAAALATGFVYYVSMTGVTGASLPPLDDVRARLGRLRTRTRVPVAVGFGVRTPAQAGALAQVADGVVVGSALVQAIAGAATPAAAVTAVGTLCADLADAVHAVRTPAGTPPGGPVAGPGG